MKMNKVIFGYYYAVLDTGKLVKITFPEEMGEEIWESLRNAWIKGGIFNEEGWNNLTIELDGESFNYLNCKRVIGIR